MWKVMMATSNGGDLFNGWPEDGVPVSTMSDRDRIMALLSPPSQDVHLTVDDARWIKAEIERLTVRNKNQCERLDQQIKHNAKLQAEIERLEKE